MANEYIIRVKVVPDFSEFEKNIKDSIEKVDVSGNAKSKKGVGSSWEREMKELSGGIEEALNQREKIREIYNKQVEGIIGNFTSFDFLGIGNLIGNVFNAIKMNRGVSKEVAKGTAVGEGASGGGMGAMLGMGEGSVGGAGGMGALGGVMAVAGLVVIVKAIYDLMVKIVQIFSESSPIFREMLDLFRRTFYFILRPIADMFGMIFMPLGMLLLGFVVGIYTAWIDKLKESGEMGSWAKFLEVMFKGGYEIGYAMERFWFDFLMQLGEMVKEGYVALSELKIDMMGNISKFVSNFMTMLFSEFNKWLTSDGKMLIAEFMNSIINVMTFSLTDSGVGDVEESGESPLTNFLNSIFDALSNILSSTNSSIDTFMSNLFATFTGWVESNSDAVGKLLDKVIDEISMWVSNNVEVLGSLINAMVEGMIEWIDNNTSIFGELAKAIVDGIGKWISGGAEPLDYYPSGRREGMGYPTSSSKNSESQAKPSSQELFGASSLTVNITVNGNMDESVVDVIIDRLRRELGYGGGI